MKIHKHTDTTIYKRKIIMIEKKNENKKSRRELKPLLGPIQGTATTRTPAIATVCQRHLHTSKQPKRLTETKSSLKILRNRVYEMLLDMTERFFLSAITLSLTVDLRFNIVFHTEYRTLIDGHSLPILFSLLFLKE